MDDLIRELGAENIPCIRVYNKSDLAFAFQRDKEGDAVSVSAKTGEGLGRLLSAIDKKLDKGTKRVTLHLPYDKAGALDSLYREAKVESVGTARRWTWWRCVRPNHRPAEGLYRRLDGAEGGVGMSDFRVPFGRSETEFTENDPVLSAICCRWRRRSRRGNLSRR